MANKENWKGRERRQFHRTPSKLQVAWHKAEDETHAAEDIALDVSIGGLALRSSVEIPVGSCIYVKIPNEEGHTVATIPSIVKWTAPHSEDNYYIIGVEFAHELDMEKELILKLGPAYLQRLGGLQNREFLRLDLKIPVFYKKSFISGWKKGVSIDVGLGGVKFLADHTFLKRSKVMLRLRIPGRGDIQAPAVVLGQTPTTTGHQYKVNAAFRAMKEESSRALADFIDSHLKSEKTADLTDTY